MEPIAIVRKRSNIWLIMIAVLIAALLVAAALWFMGDGTVIDASQAPLSRTHESLLSTAEA